MKFSEVEEWKIPEGDVYQVKDKKTSNVIWRKKLDLSLTASPSEGGTCYTSGKYFYNSTAIVNAVPSTGYEFDYWSDSGSQEHSVLMNSPKSLTAYFRYMPRPCTVIYKVNAFGCTPTLKTTIAGMLVDTTTVETGENTISISTTEGLNAKLEITDVPDGGLIYIEGNKHVGNTYEYVTFDGLVKQLNVFIIQSEHMFNGIKGEYHESTFIYSPGTLIGGLKYKLHWQSQSSADLKKEQSDAGRISFGHAGDSSSHKMHLSFGYQVNNGEVKEATVSFFDGSSTKTGYYSTPGDDTTFVKSSSADNIQQIGASGLYYDSENKSYDNAHVEINVKDIILDFTSYSMNDSIKIGIILKDYSDGCAGIIFGRPSGTVDNKKTKCTISIL